MTAVRARERDVLGSDGGIDLSFAQSSMFGVLYPLEHAARWFVSAFPPEKNFTKRLGRGTTWTDPMPPGVPNDRHNIQSPRSGSFNNLSQGAFANVN
jgi:hypothetical protein